MRLTPLVVFLGLLCLPLTSAAAQAGPPTTIAGGDLPYSVRLATADEDAFFRRINPPPVLEQTPSPRGTRYSITSAYWDQARRLTDPDAEAIDPRADYFPGEGLVRLSEGGEDVWIVLNLRQREIIDRYIRLARERLIGPEPGAFDLIRAAALSEPVAVMIANHTLTEDEARRFWSAAAPVELRRDLVRGTPEPPWPPAGPTISWIAFTYPDGRSVEMLYSSVTGVLADRFATEVYPVPQRWLEPVLGAAAPTAAQIEEDEDKGTSPLWVVLAVGGVICLVAAFWLSRRWALRDDRD